MYVLFGVVVQFNFFFLALTKTISLKKDLIKFLGRVSVQLSFNDGVITVICTRLTINKKKFFFLILILLGL